jgi:xanthine dehydrogenase iron-sulfur cluster and FAD-binding subunit A
MWTKYINAASTDEVLNELSNWQSKAKVISGGTDLMLEIERGLHNDLDVLIDISRIEGLDTITIDSNDIVHMGPLVTHNHCVSSDIVIRHGRCLAEACKLVGSPQIRNRGTIAGNLITASPANDSIPALMVLEASILLTSIKGERLVPLKDFYTGVRKTVLRPDEMLLEIQFKALPNNARSTFIKHALRKAQAISLVNAAIVIIQENDKVKEARFSVGSVTPIVKRVEDAERFIVGKELNTEFIDQTAKIVGDFATPIGDIRSSAINRSRIVSVLIQKGLRKIASEPDEIFEKPVLLWGKNSKSYKPNSKTTEIEEESTLFFKLNGINVSAPNSQHKRLIDIIRDEGHLTGTKEGCGEGECGACTVFMDGIAVMSCLVPAPRAHGSEIISIEGLEVDGKLNRLQETFIEEGAVQCGYCTPGFIMSGVKMLEEVNNPSEDMIKLGISGNLCRCTGYYKIIKAIEKAATS